MYRSNPSESGSFKGKQQNEQQLDIDQRIRKIPEREDDIRQARKLRYSLYSSTA